MYEFVSARFKEQPAKEDKLFSFRSFVRMFNLWTKERRGLGWVNEGRRKENDHYFNGEPSLAGQEYQSWIEGPGFLSTDIDSRTRTN